MSKFFPFYIYFIFIFWTEAAPILTFLWLCQLGLICPENTYFSVIHYIVEAQLVHLLNMLLHLDEEVWDEGVIV